jgi:membrane protein implicated in regulation of membrane protease activity
MPDKNILKLYLGACVLIAALFVHLVLAGIYKMIFLFLVILLLVLLLVYPGVRKVLLKSLYDLIR